MASGYDIRNLQPRFVNITGGENDGARVYLLPVVPTDAGTIEQEPDISLEEAVSITLKDVSVEQRTKIEGRVTEILRRYDGRVVDASSILTYSLEQGRFEEFAQRLEKDPKEIFRVHPKLRMARTDITAFFMQMYIDLNIGDRKSAEQTIDFDKKYGPGILVHPKLP